MKKMLLSILMIFVAVEGNEMPLGNEITNPFFVVEKSIEICPIDSIEEICPEDMIFNTLDSLHPALRNKVIQLMIESKKRGIQLVIVETYRTPERQDTYYKKSRRLTRLRGGDSKHQYGVAVDILPVINGVSQYNKPKVWKRVGLIGEKLGLRWGGRWRRLYDPAHFELKVKVDELKEGNYPAVPDSIFTVPAYLLN